MGRYVIKTYAMAKKHVLATIMDIVKHLVHLIQNVFAMMVILGMTVKSVVIMFAQDHFHMVVHLAWQGKGCI